MFLSMIMGLTYDLKHCCMSMFTGLMVNFVGLPKNSTKYHVCPGMNQDLCQESSEKC